ncbi:DegV family protein [Streptococcus sp. DD12]|uniref:DegV family protein n=1 Tax=Streptococcus sp. DD12 TaxID=1777880 RepID=UPI00079BD201|nr:DegV family protein [Streptococcus sp. DD12]KXT75944.1 DegV family protein in cluster with TrmH family tRNA/rRNA methyltransferase YacO [Streptococcus sp. DD12]
MTLRLLTDSTADLPHEWLNQHQVDVLGLTVTVAGKTYETTGPNALTAEALLAEMAQGQQPTTSQINVGQFETYFRQVAQAGDQVLYIGFNSVLSGTYQSAVMARDLVLEDYPDASIFLYDTLAASCGEGYLVMAVDRLRQEGASIEEMLAWLDDACPRLRTFFLVDDLYHLMRGGRLSKASALMGTLVNVKPLLWIDGEGKLVPLAKSRGRKKAIKEMMAQATQDLAEGTIVLAYANDKEAALALKEDLLKQEGVTEVLVMPLGPVISAHVGPNTLAAFSFGKKPRN